MSPTVAGLFAGIGGIELGFLRAGFTVISANELDAFAGETYRLNHEHKLILKDVSNLSGKELSRDLNGRTHRVNVLTGGFPCQPFSVAGHRKGFEDARGNVFWEIHRLIGELSPDVVVLENVKNLVGHDSGRTFATIQGALAGRVSDPKGNFIRRKYHVKTAVLNAKDFGVPQNRERIYVIAFKSKMACEKFSFPVPGRIKPGRLTDFIDFNKRVAEKYYYRNDKLIYPTLEKAITDQGTVYQWRRKYVRENKSNLCPTLTANMGMGGHNVPLILAKHGIRKLTPAECFRLMGIENPVFPEGMADSRLYKQAGNAVVVPVIEAIARELKKVLS